MIGQILGHHLLDSLKAQLWHLPIKTLSKTIRECHEHFYLDCSNLSQAEHWIWIFCLYRRCNVRRHCPWSSLRFFAFLLTKWTRPWLLKYRWKAKCNRVLNVSWNNLLFVSSRAEEMVVVANLRLIHNKRHCEVDCWHCHTVTHIVTHHIRDCVTDDGAIRDRGETITDLCWVIWDNEMRWATSNWCEKRAHTVLWQPGRWEKEEEDSEPLKLFLYRWGFSQVYCCI